MRKERLNEQRTYRSHYRSNKSNYPMAEDLEQQGRCSHELEEINYFYDDDWGHRGSIAWDSHWKEKEFCYCKKCGQVFLRDRGVLK